MLPAEMAHYIAQCGQVCFGKLSKELLKSVHQVHEFRVRLWAQINQIRPLPSLGPLRSHQGQAFLRKAHQTVIMAERHDGLWKLDRSTKNDKCQNFTV